MSDLAQPDRFPPAVGDWATWLPEHLSGISLPDLRERLAALESEAA